MLKHSIGKVSAGEIGVGEEDAGEVNSCEVSSREVGAMEDNRVGLLCSPLIPRSNSFAQLRKVRFVSHLIPSA